MIPTDFKSKGLSWVGNIYQKLETFYHEMDNNFSQDTVRYVEGQVHNVGENMKKIYSDVIHDLIPQSCETESMAQENSAANGLEHHGVMEDLIPRSCETQAMVQESIAANGSEHDGITEDLIPQSCETQAMAQESSAANGSEHHGIMEDLIPRSCETQAMAQESSAANGSEHHGISEVLNQSLAEAQVPDADAVKNNQCDGALHTYSPDGEELQNSNPANDLKHAATVSDSSADEADCPSEVIDSDEVDCSSEVIVGDETAPSKHSFPINNICSSKVSSSDNDYSAVHDDHDVGGSVVSVHFKSMSGTHFEIENVDVTTSTSGSLLLSELADAGMETIDLSDKVMVEDSCVIVDNSLLYEVSHRHCGNKSYKKKLQDAFSSKRRLVKEYKLLAIFHGDLDVVSRRGSVQNQVSSSIIKPSDAEWEIL